MTVTITIVMIVYYNNDIDPLNDNTDNNYHDSVIDNDNDPPSSNQNIPVRRKAIHKKIHQDNHMNNDNKNATEQTFT